MMKQTHLERPKIDWVLVGLIVLVVFSPVAAITAADWADGLDVLWRITLVAVLAGMAISISRFRAVTAHLLSLIYGLAWVGFVLASPLPRSSWHDKILLLYTRIANWIALVAKGGTGRDDLLFVLVLALLFWWLAYIAIWNTVRQQRVFRALLPAGIALLINVYYYVGSNKLTPYMMIYLLCSLLVVVRSYTDLQESRWLNERIGYNSDVRFDLLRFGGVLAVVAIALAWVAPTSATSGPMGELWQRVEGPWHRVEDDFNRMFSTLRSQARAYGNPFGRTLTLRGPRKLTDTPVLQVQTIPGKRYYWRGIVYDRYTGSSWINTDSQSLQLEPWVQPNMPEYQLREEVTQTVGLFLPANTLIFGAGDPERVSLSTRADGRILPDAIIDISQFISNRSLLKGASYQVASSLSTADPDTLRKAGADYPSSIRDRYLQLPSNLPDAIRKQAQDIAGSAVTPYDKAAAIEAWLRQNITYDENTPAPPDDTDGVTYLLSIRRGYCDYYATAMIIMLRTQGVPARMAVGYAQGKYDTASGIYKVTEKDSHSWVEVYFPKYGWIEFEPTAAQPNIERPEAQIATPTPTAAPTTEGGTPGASAASTRRGREDIEDPYTTHGGKRPGGVSGWIWALLGLAAVAGSTMLGMVVFERQGLGGLSPAAQLYARLLRFSRWLQVKWQESQTPRERGQVFSRAVPGANDLIMRVADDYTREQYAPPKEREDPAAFEQTWKSLRPALWLAGLRLRLDQFRRAWLRFRDWFDALVRRLNSQLGR